MSVTKIRVLMKAGNDSMNASEFEFHKIEKFFPNIWEAITFVVDQTHFNTKTGEILDGMKEQKEFYKKQEINDGKFISILIQEIEA